MKKKKRTHFKNKKQFEKKIGRRLRRFTVLFVDENRKGIHE
jgi:hypothetical protein